MKRLLSPGLALASALAVAPSASAQIIDTDGDGVADAADLFPCDAAAAAEAYAPARATFGMVMFEDEWPSTSDLDFDDVVVGYNYAYKLDGAGRATSIRATLHVLAAGGLFHNGLGLALPVPAGAVASVTRTVSGQSPSNLSLFAQDANATFVVFDDVRAALGDALGVVNSDPAQPRVPSLPVVIDITLAAPVMIDTTEAPHDLFVFRSADPTHEIHRSAYSGTSRMNSALFGTGIDASTPGRWFVEASGLPFSLVLPGERAYPAEGLGISNLYPDIVPWAASAGTTNTTWYDGPTNPAAAYPTPVNSTFVGSPTFVADRACVPAHRSCEDVKNAGNSFDGVYAIDPDGTGGQAPFDAYCDLTRDGGGWTLVAKVHTANSQHVSEPRTWWDSQRDLPAMLHTSFTVDRGVSSQGASRFEAALTSSSLAKFELVAHNDVNQRANWYKRISVPSQFSSWVQGTTSGITPTRTCSDLAMTANCSDNVVGFNGSVTSFGGMNLGHYGFSWRSTPTAPPSAACDIHMRVDQDQAPHFSAVCSCTYNDPAWRDSAIDGHWGNAMLIWVR